MSGLGCKDKNRIVNDVAQQNKNSPASLKVLLQTLQLGMTWDGRPILGCSIVGTQLGAPTSMEHSQMLILHPYCPTDPFIDANIDHP